jgi:hypothetical protein
VIERGKDITLCAEQERQGRIRGLAWGGEVTPLGINYIALISTLPGGRRM